MQLCRVPSHPSRDANYLRSHLITTLSAETDEELRIDAGFWLPAKIGDKVFCDENGDGIINTGEQLIGSGQYGLDDGQLVLEVKPGYQLATGQTDFIIGYDF